MVRIFMLAVALFVFGCVAEDASVIDAQPLDDEAAIIIECAIPDEDGYCSCPPCDPPAKATVNDPEVNDPEVNDPESRRHRVPR